jgi:hypothetical protein
MTIGNVKLTLNFYFLFFAELECVGHSFAYVAHFVFLRDVWTRTQRAAVASWRTKTYLVTHLTQLATHLTQLVTHLTQLATHLTQLATHLTQLATHLTP